jgi:hypothetical protein
LNESNNPGLLPGAGAERRAEAYPVCPVCDKMLDRVAEYTLECPGCRCQFHPEHLALARASRAAELAAAVKDSVPFTRDACGDVFLEFGKYCMVSVGSIRDKSNSPMVRRLLSEWLRDNNPTPPPFLSPPGDAAERKG